MVIRLTLIVLFCLLVASHSADNLIPLPRLLIWGTGKRIISPSIYLDEDGWSQQIFAINDHQYVIQLAFAKTMDLIFKTKWHPVCETGDDENVNVENDAVENDDLKTDDHDENGQEFQEIFKVSIEINNDADLQLHVDESYILNVEDEITIVANTTWGILNGFKTLQQLIVYKDGLFFIENKVKIVDAPLFAHRGVMIDSARNFIPVNSIKEQLKLMSYVKLNTLHWHLVDSQSWPIEVESYPEMIDDAYSSREFYTVDDIKDIVQYAYMRGIRVVPEIDMPGHALAGWRKVDPDLIACGNCFWNENVPGVGPVALEPPAGQLDVTYEKTYEVVRNVYNDIRKLFCDKVFHVGLDELLEACYLKSPVKQFFVDNRTMNDLTQHWLNNSLPIFNDSRITVWADVLIGKSAAHSVPKTTILQVWEGKGEEVKQITAAGYDVVVSPNSFYYLDCGSSSWVFNDPRYVEDPENDEFNYGNAGSPCGPYKSWQRIYNYNIVANLTRKERKHVLGAEVAAWGEQIDSLVLTSKIWPRAAALAESLWSGNRNPITGYYRTKAFTPRIINFREFLVKLGYSVKPIVPKYCIKNLSSCNLRQNDILRKYGKFFY